MRLSKEESRFVQSLHHKKGREEHGCFVAEGSKIVAEILESQLLVKTIYHAGPLPAAFMNHASLCKEVEADQLQKLSALTTASGMLAVVALPGAANHLRPRGWTLALDGIQNPGNLGALLRLADWFGIEQIVASPDTADVFNPKVIQGSMGSFLRVQVIYQPLESWLQNTHLPVMGAVLNGTNIKEIKQVTTEGILVIGNEGQGIRPSVAALLTQGVTIGRKGRAESLNAAVAAGILLQHLVG